MTTEYPLISAEFIFDGTAEPIVPPRMGTARADQLQGTWHERLAEIAGRVCYDSLGKGRDSRAYHEHILAVRHLSVLEHVVFTVEIKPADDTWLPAGEFAREKLLPIFLNRPGVFVRMATGRSLFVTLNARSVLEWERWSSDMTHPWRCAIWHGLIEALGTICPTITLQSGIARMSQIARDVERQNHKKNPQHDLQRIQVRTCPPTTDDERWVTLLLTGSRGMSHELVRHGDFTAISQRSTRYVDESQSEWVEHPLVTAFKADENMSPSASVQGSNHVVSNARTVYDLLVVELQDWLAEKSVDKLTARKQARGAARGYLGNALYTEVVFSASIAQWRRMIAARASEAADAEIRAVFVGAIRAMQERGLLTDLVTRPSPDGIGEVVG